MANAALGLSLQTADVCILTSAPCTRYPTARDALQAASRRRSRLPRTLAASCEAPCSAEILQHYKQPSAAAGRPLTAHSSSGACERALG